MPPAALTQRRRQTGVTLLLGAVAALGAGLILLREVNYGVGLTWDSVVYLGTARNLVAGDGFVSWNFALYTTIPLFPLLLAALGLLGIDPAAAAGAINAAAFGLTAAAVAAWLQRHVRSPWLAVWAACACASLPILAEYGAIANTETIFVLSVVVALWQLDRFLSTGALAALLFGAAAAGAACLARYPGLALAGCGVLVLSLRNGAAVRTRIRDAAIWSGVSVTPIGVWMVRNVIAGKPAFGTQVSFTFSGLSSLHAATGELAVWLFGREGLDVLNGLLRSVAAIDLTGPATPAAIAVKAVLLAAPVLGAGYALARYRRRFFRKQRAVLTVCVAFVAVYSLALAISLPLNDVELEVRYLVPLFPPLLVTSALVLDELLARADGPNAKPKPSPNIAGTGRVLLAIAMSLWLILQVRETYYDTRYQMEYGFHYASRRWFESDVIRYLNASNRLDGAVAANTVASNSVAAIYVHTDFGGVLGVGATRSELMDQVATWRPGQRRYFIWFDESPYEIHYRVEEVASELDMELVADLDDGVIYRLRAAEEGAASPSAR